MERLGKQDLGCSDLLEDVLDRRSGINEVDADLVADALPHPRAPPDFADVGHVAVTQVPRGRGGKAAPDEQRRVRHRHGARDAESPRRPRAAHAVDEKRRIEPRDRAVPDAAAEDEGAPRRRESGVEERADPDQLVGRLWIERTGQEPRPEPGVELVTEVRLVTVVVEADPGHDARAPIGRGRA